MLIFRFNIQFAWYNSAYASIPGLRLGIFERRMTAGAIPECVLLLGMLHTLYY